MDKCLRCGGGTVPGSALCRTCIEENKAIESLKKIAIMLGITEEEAKAIETQEGKHV